MNTAKEALTLLHSAHPEEIREGARLAGERQLSEAIPALVTHLSSNNAGVLEAVERALLKINAPEAVPALIPLLRQQSATTRNSAMELLRHTGVGNIAALSALLSDSDPDIRIFAADILGSVGDASVIRDLCTALRNDPVANVRYQAAISLGVLKRPESVPSLCAALTDEEWVQFAAIDALANINAPEAAEPMLQALQTCSELVASTIVDALGSLADIKAVPILLKRLDVSPTPLCNKIIKAIVNILGEKSLSLLGPKDCNRLADYMRVALDDELPDIQDAAIKGFSSLPDHVASAKIIDIAAGIDQETDLDRYENAVSSLVQIGMTPALEKALSSTKEAYVTLAMTVIDRIENVDLIPLLKKIFWSQPRDIQRLAITVLDHQASRTDQDFFLEVLDKHEDGTVLRSALHFLGCKGNPEDVQDQVLRLLHHPYDDVKEEALNAAIRLNTPLVKQCFKDLAVSPDPMERLMAVYGMGQLGCDEFLPELRQGLQDSSPEVRKYSVAGLAKEGELSEECFKLIAQMLSDPSSDVRITAVESLGNSSLPEALNLITSALQDPDTWVKIRCVEKISLHRSLESVKHLIPLLEEPNPLITIKVIKALGFIGGETAFRALMELLAHADPDIQTAAEEAVKTMQQQVGA